MKFNHVSGILALAACFAATGFALAGAPAPATAPARMRGVAATSTAPATERAAAATPASTAPAKISDLKLTLMDGSVLAGKLSVPELAIDTKFGPLKVPVDQIQSFMPGLSSHAQFRQQVLDYVNDLGADLFADREKAQIALTKLGPEIRPELERLAKTAESEKLNRIQKILEDFESAAADDEVKPMGWVNDDVIVTSGFTVVGHITTPGFSISSNYGNLTLKIEDVRVAARDVATPEDIRKTVSVPGTAFAMRQYTTTSIKLSKGDQVSITATGQISMTPWGNNQTCTPDGNSRFGDMGGIFAGTLIGRVGDSGPVIKIGSKANFTADRSGVFQLSISSNGDYPGNNFPGEYSVKIRVVKK